MTETLHTMESLNEIIDELCELLADEDRLRTCQVTQERVLHLEHVLDRMMNPAWFMTDIQREPGHI